MRLSGIVGVCATFFGLIASGAPVDGAPQPDDIWRHEALEMSKAATGQCESCFLLAALGSYFALPNRYILQGVAKMDDRCISLVAPGPAFGDSLSSPLYKAALETQSGHVRVCPREVADLEMIDLQKKRKPTSVRVEGEITIANWTSKSMASRFTTTIIYSSKEALIVSDVNPQFADTLLKTSRRIGE